MTKIKILVCALTVLCAASCSKDKIPTSLTGTKWGTTFGGYKIELNFANVGNTGVLSVTNPAEGINEKIDYTYTYTNTSKAGSVVMKPTDPEYAADYPNGIKATIRGNGTSMEFPDLIPGEEITLAKIK